MTPDQILEQLVDRHRVCSAEFELGGDTGDPWLFDELADAWRAAQAEATDAYEHWRETPGAEAFAVYRAAQDRADQAQDVVAGSARTVHVAELTLSRQGAALHWKHRHAYGQATSPPPATWSEAGSDPAGGRRLLRP